MQKGKKFLSDLKLHSDYLKWNEDLGRYETWEEACESIISSHVEKYGDKIKPYTNSALQSMKEKMVLASQRSLQYRGEQLKAHSSRLYNCTTGYVAYNRAFQEVFYLLLSGCGFGGGLQIPFVKNISNIEKRKNGTKTFIIPDSIEGWSDSLGVLMSSYFTENQPFPEYFGYEIKFDFSKIRKKGAFISGGFKAPGPEGLQKSLEQIESLIENWLAKEGSEVRPILAFDILCFASNAVLSGGVRRSAMNMIIDENDDEMINAKMGNWFENNPQRARSNNSILLIRNKVTKEKFESIVKMNDGISDIGFVFANSYFDMFNPCFTGDMEILTNNGYKRFDELIENEHYVMINGVGQEVTGYVKKTGIKNVIDIKLSTGKIITCTPDHILLTSDGTEIEAKDTKDKALLFFKNEDKKFSEIHDNQNDEFPIVIGIEHRKTKEVVYDFELDDLTHHGVVNGLVVHNCFEIAQLPILWNDKMDLENIKYGEIYDFVKENSQLLGIQGCVAYDTKLITRSGIETIGDVAENNREIEIWNGEKWSLVKPIKTGSNRKLYRVFLNDGSHLDCTENHKFLVKNRFEKVYKEIETVDLIKLLSETKYNLQVPRVNISDFDYGKDEIYAYDYGFILGDGTCKKFKDGTIRTPFASVYETNFKNDYPFVEGRKSKLLTETYNGIEGKYYNVVFDKLDKEFSLKLKYDDGLPSELFSWSRKSIIDFIAGWIDTDGTITYNNKFRIYGEKDKIEDLQLLLTKIGVNSTVNLMSKKGTITNLGIRKRDVWYIQVSDCGELWCTKTKFTKTVVKCKGQLQNIEKIIELDGLHDSYCFEESEKHQGVFNNILTKQCNLTEISAEACTTKEKFFRACYDASVLGTLQAGWTTFPYLGEVSENIFKKEALLGVSITGWMNNPKLFNPELLQKGVEIIKKTNEEVAKLININISARVCCVKPSGNSSVILGTSSGIHPEHSQQYFRIMQLNKEAETAKWLNENMNFLLEDSVWSENKTDYVVFIPIENSKDGFYKKDMTGLAHLEKIKLVQKNWVSQGTNRELSGYKNITHNVSCTVIIDDVETVINYIWDNKEDFTAVSFISNTADRVYNQAPFTTVNSMEEIIETYGKASLFVSGLIVDGLHHFKNNLWLACDSVLDKSIPVTGTREEVLLKKYWIDCAKKFSKNYFKGDLKKTVYCLKDVHLLHKWEVINRQMREVDFNKILNKPTFKDVSDYAAQACSGGACEIVRA